MAKHCVMGKDYGYQCEITECCTKELCRRMYDEKNNNQTKQEE